MPSYPTYFAGTPKTWKSTGGDYALTLTSVANDAAREGGKGDFYHATYGLPEYLEIRFETAVASAATSGKAVELWIGESDSATAGTDNPGNLTGVDAVWSTPNELKSQLRTAGGVILSNARGTSVQKQRTTYYPSSRYIIPAVVNKSGVSLSGTAGTHTLIITPYYLVIQ